MHVLGITEYVSTTLQFRRRYPYPAEYFLHYSPREVSLDHAINPNASTYWEDLTRNDPSLSDSNMVASPFKSTAFIKDQKNWYGEREIIYLRVTRYNCIIT